MSEFLDDVKLKARYCQQNPSLTFKSLMNDNNSDNAAKSSRVQEIWLELEKCELCKQLTLIAIVPKLSLTSPQFLPTLRNNFKNHIKWSTLSGTETTALNQFLLCMIVFDRLQHVGCLNDFNFPILLKPTDLPHEILENLNHHQAQKWLLIDKYPTTASLHGAFRGVDHRSTHNCALNEEVYQLKEKEKSFLVDLHNIVQVLLFSGVIPAQRSCGLLYNTALLLLGGRIYSSPTSSVSFAGRRGFIIRSILFNHPGYQINQKDTNAMASMRRNLKYEVEQHKAKKISNSYENFESQGNDKKQKYFHSQKEPDFNTSVMSGSSSIGVSSMFCWHDDVDLILNVSSLDYEDSVSMDVVVGHTGASYSTNINRTSRADGDIIEFTEDNDCFSQSIDHDTEEEWSSILDNLFQRAPNKLYPVENDLEWLLPLDTIDNSYECCIVSLNNNPNLPTATAVFGIDHDPSVVLLKVVSELLKSNEEYFGRCSINNDIVYNPARNMKATIYVKFIDYSGDLLVIKTFIENNIEFTCDTIDVVLDGACRQSYCCNPEMETLNGSSWPALDWSSVQYSGNLSSYVQSIQCDHGDFVMFGPTYDYVVKLWLPEVSLWILYSDPISRHFMYTPNEQRVVRHNGLRVHHFYGNLERQRFDATNVGLRHFWQNTDSTRNYYVGNAFYAAHPTIHADYMRRATIGPSVRSFCPDLPAEIIPDNWFVSAAHTFTEPDVLNNGKTIIPPIPFDSPIFDTTNPGNYRKIGTYLGHDKSQCTAIIQITCPNMLNLMKVTCEDLLSIVGPDSDEFVSVDIDNIDSPVWKSVIYKSGAATATTCGVTYSYGSMLSPRFKGGRVFSLQFAQYLMVQRFPIVNNNDNKFSDCGDSGAGVHMLTSADNDANQHSAKVFGLVEGGMNVGTTSGPICSAIQPIHVQSLRSLALRTAHYQSKIFKAIESFIKNPYCFLCRLSRYIATFVDNSSTSEMSLFMEKIILKNLLR